MDLTSLSTTQLRVLAALLVLITLAPAVLTLLLARQQRRRRRYLATRLRVDPVASAAITSAPSRRRLDLTAIAERIRAQVIARLPIGELSSDTIRHRLLLAGFTSDDAPALLTLIRGATGTLAALAVLIVLRPEPLALLLLLTLTLFVIGWLAPLAGLQSLMRKRQQAIRRAIPDVLDLLVICLEAGVSQDAALQRVARESIAVHRELGTALLELTGRIAAGVTRERAFEMLYERTGVDELRSLTSHFIQADSWGTSITTVLRIYGEQVRRDRRTAAEQRAATASTRMLIPLILFILPTLFIVLLGPAGLRLTEALGN